MDYEERYNVALEKARELLSCCINDRDRRTKIYRVEDIESIFPELKESENERIRKAIISCCIDHGSKYKYLGVSMEEIPNCLEKQVEHTNKVEPKFKVGDWVVFIASESIYQVEKIENYEYTLRHILGGSLRLSFSNEELIREWTIADAKEGDVLWHSDTASNGIFIFKKIRHDGKVLCYCDYDSEDHFCTGEYHTCCWSDDKYIKPATKEQRDILFTKMEEAGYEWDVKNKCLTKK